MYEGKLRCLEIYCDKSILLRCFWWLLTMKSINHNLITIFRFGWDHFLFFVVNYNIVNLGFSFSYSEGKLRDEWIEAIKQQHTFRRFTFMAQKLATATNFIIGAESDESVVAQLWLNNLFKLHFMIIIRARFTQAMTNH